MEKKEIKIKCPNDLRVSAKKDNGELVLDEDCCTTMIFLLKNTGEVSTSFLGGYSDSVVSIFKKAQKKYMKSLVKSFKNSNIKDDFTLEEKDLPDDKKLKDSELKEKPKKSKNSEFLKSKYASLEKMDKKSTSSNKSHKIKDNNLKKTNLSKK